MIEDALRQCDFLKAADLIRKGADVHVNNNGALRYGAQQGFFGAVRLLIKKGADIHADNDAALRSSARFGYANIVQLLIEKGANIHGVDDYALKWSARNGYSSIVKLLVEKGANIHAEDDAALRWSAWFGHIDVVRYLVEKGANVHAKDGYALTYSTKLGHTAVADYLLQHMATNTATSTATTIKISKTTKLAHTDSDSGTHQLVLLEDVKHAFSEGDNLIVKIGITHYCVINTFKEIGVLPDYRTSMTFTLPMDTSIKMNDISAKITDPLTVTTSGTIMIILPRQTRLFQYNGKVKLCLEEDTEVELV